MSHFVNVQTQATNPKILVEVAKKLGLKPVERKIVHGYVGQTTKADIVMQVSKQFDVGFIKDEKTGTYAIVADWWGCDLTIPGLQNKLLQAYAVQTVINRAKRLGHTITQKQQKDGSIKMVVKTTA